MSQFIEHGTEWGPVVHEISEDGRKLVSRYGLPSHRNIQTTLHWDSREKAEENYQTAMANFERDLPMNIIKIKEQDPGTSRSRLRILYKGSTHSLTLFTNSGPPYWRKPQRAPSGWGFGWLRWCFSLHWEEKA